MTALQGSLLPDSAEVGADGWLHIGGCHLGALADEFGTPLFVYDEDHLRTRCREAVAAFGDGVAYASKAFLCLAMAKLAHEEGMHLDVATGGELHVALTAGVPADRLVLHGNNKSLEELRTARSAGTPAARATGSSPPVATSRCMPSSWARRAMAVHRNALVA